MTIEPSLIARPSSLETTLMPGERVLSECGQLYATSRRLLRCEAQGGRVFFEELPYQQLTGVEVVRKANHPMMALGVMAVIGAIFMTITGLIFVTAFLAVGGGLAMLLYGSKGNNSYYQLHIDQPPAAPNPEPPTELEVALERVKGALGIGAEKVDKRWRVDYVQGRTFIATVRTIRGGLPEL